MGLISLQSCHLKYNEEKLISTFKVMFSFLFAYFSKNVLPLANESDQNSQKGEPNILYWAGKNGVKIDLSPIREFAAYKFVAVGKWKCPQQPEEGAGQGCIIHNLRSEGRIGKQEGKKRLLLICIFEPLWSIYWLKLLVYPNWCVRVRYEAL